MAPTGKHFVCSCQEELWNEDDVDRHDKNWFKLGHTKQCQFKDCDKVSPQTYNAKRHWRTHLPAELGKHFCKKCSTSYAKKQDLKKHEAADTCRYNRQKCQTKSEHSPGVSILPNPMQNDSSIASAYLSQREPAQSRDLPKDISLPPVSARILSSTESSHSTQDHLGYFPFLDDRVGVWSDWTAADLDDVFETMSPNLQHMPPPQLAPGECEMREPDPSINSGNLGYIPWQMSAQKPQLSSLSPPSPPPQPLQPPQRACLAVEIEMVLAKIRGLCRGDRSRIETVSTTKTEDKVTCYSLPFRLRRSATPSTKQSVA
jgi:hypothetical protein